MFVFKKEIIIYRAPSGHAPFIEWMRSIKDKQSKYVIRTRLDRASGGNLGDYKAVGQGVLEMRIRFGPGFRVYFGLDGDSIVVLLCGGEKSSQERDIAKAKMYWSDYWRANHE